MKLFAEFQFSTTFGKQQGVHAAGRNDGKRVGQLGASMPDLAV